MNIFQDIVTYAFRGGGKYVLIFGAILSVAADLAGFMPILGILAALLLSGYICAIYFEIIQTTATGSSEAPAFPETSSVLSDLIVPMLQVFEVLLVSFGPWLGYLIWVDEANLHSGVFFGLLALGIVYFPMAMLAVVVLGYMGAVSPHIVIPAIFRGGWLYWVGVLLLFLLYLLEKVVGDFLAGHVIIGTLVAAVVGMYTMITNGRILGIVYREREDELGWV